MKKKIWIPAVIVICALIYFVGFAPKQSQPTFKKLANSSSIQIWSQHSYATSKEKLIVDVDNIESVINFIDGVKYTLDKTSDNRSNDRSELWLFRFKFDDRRKEIFFYDDYAYLGKDKYEISKYTADDFLKLYDSF
ncbi:MAG: hypothetical protein P9L92_03895 [Candidatus Electryonea clarkiae]|nr:hypothetical protein [Candidatus Electryonea clarkiae]